MSEKVYDLIVIGSGPSSLTAAIYATREDISTLIYERSTIGGHASIIDRVDNYPGFPEGVEGYVLAENLEKQAKRFGADIEYETVTKVEDKGDIKIVTVSTGKKKAKALLIATGCSYDKIDAPGEAESYGKGVHYCATCDGAFYKGKRIAVVGGGNSAIQETLYLTRFADHIDLLVRSYVKASNILQKRLTELVNEGKIKLHLGTTIDEIVSDNGRMSHIKATENGKPIKIDVDGIFVFAGLKPNTDFLINSGIKLDEGGYIKTDDRFQTNIKGIFASGDVRSGAIKQIACATGEGVVVAHSIREYLDS